MAARRKYPDELRERAVRLVIDNNYPLTQVSRDLGVHYSVLRRWVRQAEADNGKRGDLLTTDERDRLKELERENRQLKKALGDKHLSADDLARELQVDSKTVKRWLNNGSVPHQHNRNDVAKLLDVPAVHLWPVLDGDLSTDGHVASEICGAYTHRADVTNERWRLLLEGAEKQIDLLGYAMQFLPEQITGLTDILRNKAADGCNTRIAFCLPESEHVAYRDQEEGLSGTLKARIYTTLKYLKPLPLQGVDGVEVNFYEAPLYNSVFRFDDDIFFTFHLYGNPGYLSPLLHIKRLGGSGIFDEIAGHFERVWSASEPDESIF